jgi:hypothetical protein
MFGVIFEVPDRMPYSTGPLRIPDHRRTLPRNPGTAAESHFTRHRKKQNTHLYDLLRGRMSKNGAVVSLV